MAPASNSSYRPDFALGYAHAYGKKHKLTLKVRVDPAILTKLTCHNPDEHALPREYRVPDKGYIRPVAVCVYTVK
ncbi:hypothetical protein AAVH_37440 [Aphelenchoides avenae]|nr:hypothetical protein AAVH_37440 [Aphelenchus avenae]